MNRIASTIAALSLLLAGPALAASNCDAIKADIAQKLDAKGIKDYTLTIIGKDDPAHGSVVGYCELGQKAIVLKHR